MGMLWLCTPGGSSTRTTVQIEMSDTVLVIRQFLVGFYFYFTF